MRTRGLAIVVALVILTQFSFGHLWNTAVALAAGTTNPCHDPTPARYLPNDDRVIGADLGPLTEAGRNKIGSPGDTERATRDLSSGSSEALAAERARKEILNASVANHGSMTVLPDRATLERECARAGTSSFAGLLQRLAGAASTSAVASWGSGYRWMDWMNQQGQLFNTWCGPATVSEIANTMKNNGRLTDAVTQNTAATSMGTNDDGTSVTNEVAGLNQYVAQPIVHSNYYFMVWVSGSADPTTHSAEVNAFINNLDYDLRNGWVIGGDGWESPGDFHLVGHPANLEIKHWFQVGGYQSYGASTYYSDSATTMGWSGVQPFSWYDTGNLIYIFGGFGYAY